MADPKIAPLTLQELGNIVLKEAGASACMEGYGTIDPVWVGKHALMYGDIERDGTMT